VKNTLDKLAFGAAMMAAVGGGVACGGSTSSGPLDNVDALVILQRPKRNDSGDIFQYTSYIAGARIVKLEPPTADGVLTTLCCDKAGAEFANIDISNYDLSFDAKQIVFSGKLSATTNYGLFILTLADGSVTQLPTDPDKDYVAPIFLPDNKIMFTTNEVVEPGAPQHEDEYERGTTTQMGIINTDGTAEQLGPRNLSHRTAPSLASDGRVIFTQWDHLGEENAGHLMFMNTDMSESREAFGKEGTAASNSTLKAVEIAPGRFVGIGTARNRTINAGALLDIRLGYPTTDGNGNVRADTSMSEAHASYHLLSPDVPLDNSPSANTVGRYYDAFALDQKDYPQLLVSWADGPVESSALAAAGTSADFGIYLYDSKSQERHPILDDHTMWDIYARPLQPRTAPSTTSSQSDGTLSGETLFGAMNVYTSTLHTFAPGSIYGVRLMEGFSSEEGFPRDFGTTEFEGHANLGVAPVQSDGSWLAKAPANVPIHMQTVDVYGMSLFNEPVWVSGRANESRVCGGCHEDRAVSTIINPGITVAQSVGPIEAYGNTPRAMRQSNDFSQAKIMGIPWDKALQPVFDAKCISCHNGDANLMAGGKLANPTYTISDPTTGANVTWTFDLRGQAVTLNVGGTMLETFTASYFTMAGPDMEAIEKGNLMISGDFHVYINPEDARDSLALTELNPPQQFPTQDPTKRAFNTATHAATYGFTDMTPDEYYALILAADMGANFYARENNPHVQ
jgi:hypothetical protein